MDASTAPGSLIWNPNDCSGFTATPILPNNTASDRVCGYQTSNTTLMQSCCSGSEVKQYSCWSYCATDQQFGAFANCFNQALGSNSTTAPYGLFCQGNSTGKIMESVKSSAGSPRVRSPGLSSFLIVACLLAAFLIGPTSATTIPSPPAAQGIARRASSSCSYTESHHFVRSDGQRQISPSFSGSASQGAPVTLEAKRSINGSTALSTSYDSFFDVVSNVTGRQFPAQGSVELFYEFSCGAAGQTCYATFTPYLWCTNGTASGCEKELSGSVGSTTAVEACGPVFVSDNNSTEPQTAESVDGAMIQGVLGVVNTG